MCVLTYIPHKDGRVTITHNRDEHILRPQAVPPQTYRIGNEEVIFPKDPQGGGTWFAVHKDTVLCLLNGGFEAHESKPPYKESRGKIITNFFENNNSQSFVHNFIPFNFEPFTLIIFNLKEQKIEQLVWDSHFLHFQNIDSSKAQIWSSSTLYNAKIKDMRCKIFKQFSTIQPTANQIIDFHKINIDNDLHKSFFVNINDKIKTVAITQVSGRHQAMKLNYQSFYKNATLNNQ